MDNTFDPNAAAVADSGIYGLPCTAEEAQIIIIPGIARNRTIVRHLDVKRIGKRNRHHDRAEGMIPVRPLAEDLKREIDLGVGRDFHRLRRVRDNAPYRRSRIAASTFAKSFASFAFGIVENARRMRPESMIVPVEYFSMRCLRTFSASTPIGFTHMK